MRIRFRPLREGEANAEFVFGMLFVPIATVVAVVLSLVPDSCIPACVFHSFTGIPCPTCGAVRCTRLFLQGNLLGAWEVQPLMTALVLLALVYAAYAWVVILFRLPRLRLEGVSTRTRWLAFGALAALILANWAYLVIVAV